MEKKASLVIIIVIIISVAIFITICMNPRIIGGNAIRESEQEIAYLKQKNLDLQNTIESIQKNETDLRQEIDIIKRYIQQKQTVIFEGATGTKHAVMNDAGLSTSTYSNYSIDCCILGCNLKKNNIDNDCDIWGCYHSQKEEFEPCQETKDGLCICEKFQVECSCVF